MQTKEHGSKIRYAVGIKTIQRGETKMKKHINIVSGLVVAGLFAVTNLTFAAPPNPKDAHPSTKNVHQMGSVPKPATFSVPDGQRVVSSDLAFQGRIAYQGNYNGFRVIDISAPGNPKLIAETECNGDQGDIVVWDNILVRTWNTITSGISAIRPARRCWEHLNCPADRIPRPWRAWLKAI
jgi:hypothetical protein